ncbi:MAG: ABC transporter ATP-binding protein [Deltaproteobacteria bacterium]|nr:ABC transporter ATP-binding protein [Deltaproteobacteria bacterium]
MSSDVAIRVHDLSKCYQIYDRPHDRLKQSLYPRLQRLVGKPPKQYHREFWALKDVSFEVKKGETIGIIGRNGSGKSTLLQLICGTLTPTGGAVETNGRIAALLELGSGFNPEFTGRENVYMNASILGLTEAEIDVRYDDIVAFADIGDFLDQPVKTYSSGMYVRLAFAVIANVDADILVIDEALAVGDAFFTQKCMRFLRKFRENGTILFVSHDTAAVIALCQGAYWLHQGMIWQSGTPKEVSEAYLADFFEAQQGPGAVSARSEKESTYNIDVPITSYRDMRCDFINATNLRNDIELFQFQPDAASFGQGGAHITSVVLADEAGAPLIWVVGGENVRLIITCRANKELVSPIIGFYIKDRLGQILFGDNTFLAYMHKPITVEFGHEFQAQFDFCMPILPAGDYSICAAVAEGTQHDHVQHQWLHDALMLRSNSSSVCTGLVGVPVQKITLSTSRG